VREREREEEKEEEKEEKEEERNQGDRTAIHSIFSASI